MGNRLAADNLIVVHCTDLSDTKEMVAVEPRISNCRYINTWILNVDSRHSTDALHTQTGIKWLVVSRNERCCIEAYKALHGLSSDGVQQLFPKATHERNLRSSAIPNCVPKLEQL